jgi:osmotically-inducible protein OsmY
MSTDEVLQRDVLEELHDEPSADASIIGVADDLVERLPDDKHRTDADIAKAAIDTLRWHSHVPVDLITVTVDREWLTLEGKVNWQYRRDAAAAAVRHLTGVRGVTNVISLKPHVEISASEVKRRICAAFRRSAELEARRIGIDAHDGVVVLYGNVRDWAEVQEAQRAAYAVPGVVEVENRLAVVS